MVRNNMKEDKSFEIGFKELDENFILSLIVTIDKLGIIYKTTGVLFGNDWDIKEASAETLPGHLVKDYYTIYKPILKEDKQDELLTIKNDLTELFDGKISMNGYMVRKGKFNATNPSNLDLASKVTIYNPKTSDATIIDIRAKDRPGLLFQISQVLYFSAISIISITAHSESGEIRDTFLVKTDKGQRLQDYMMERLTLSLKSII